MLCAKEGQLLNPVICFYRCREALLSVSQNFFEEIDLGAGDVKVGAQSILLCLFLCLYIGFSACLAEGRNDPHTHPPTHPVDLSGDLYFSLF